MAVQSAEAVGLNLDQLPLLHDGRLTRGLGDRFCRVIERAQNLFDLTVLDGGVFVWVPIGPAVLVVERQDGSGIGGGKLESIAARNLQAFAGNQPCDHLV